jgi:hypothetical protein
MTAHEEKTVKLYIFVMHGNHISKFRNFPKKSSHIDYRIRFVPEKFETLI